MKRFLLSLISIGFSLLIGATDILIETEAFQNKGGWAVDQQFMNLMGSPYLLAHGLGTPVADATTILSVMKGGRYCVYVRTYNWTAPFSGGKKGPGAFQLTIGENFRSEQLGTIGHGWYWQEVGQVELEKGETKLALHDLTGFDGRCDAILLTTSKTFNPNAVAQPTAWRRSLQKVQADQSQTFDLVVVGGGIAGMCAAMAAARQHLRVALVNDRFVLGGNNSSEVRVHLSGVSETGKYPRLGRMIREFGHTRSGNAMPAEYYEDQKKDSFILSEKNITLFAGFRAIDVKTTNNRIDHVVIEQIETAQRIVLEAGLFSDCTGDGTIGALAGADYSMGREARYEYNESLAPEYADTLVMGSSLQWYSKPTDKPVAFPLFEYGMAFNEQNAQFVNSMLTHFDTYGYLPIWDLWGQDNYCMIGNHAIPVVADAVMKGLPGVDAERALKACVASATVSHPGSPFELWEQYGYMPEDKQTQSVSITLEQAFDDWCVAQLAAHLGKTDIYKRFVKRSQNYRHLFNPANGFFQAKTSDGQWLTPFNPLRYGGNGGYPYTEGNAWQWSWYVPHDIDELIALQGGAKKFCERLDRFFTLEEQSGEKNDNASGFIGQYVHGNEPSHHVAYLYDYAGQPRKTQSLVHKICTELYNCSSNGYAGNDDCGEMSSWFVFSSMGFYPVCPVGGQYAIGTPLFDKVTIHLSDDKQFEIVAHRKNPSDFYIRSMKLNGKTYRSYVLRHDDIVRGGRLEVYM